MEMMGKEQGMAPDADDMEQGGYCIKLYVAPGGEISVSSTPDEAPEGGQPVGSMGEAIKMVMDIYENGGDAEAGEEDFAAGFGGPAMREGE